MVSVSFLSFCLSLFIYFSLSVPGMGVGADWGGGRGGIELEGGNLTSSFFILAVVCVSLRALF